MTNQDKLKEAKEGLEDAITKLNEVKEYQIHHNMSRSLQEIVEFIDDDVPDARYILEEVLKKLESIELEDEE